jgi:ribonuclease HII
MKLKENHLLDQPLETYDNEIMAIIDGNYFNPYTWFDQKTQCIRELPFVTIEQGDAKYVGIAAASILAKVARDEYISELCEKYPLLTDYYSLNTNMGYGTKAHMNGIKEHGITEMHRKTFGELCKKSAINKQIIQSNI